VGLILDIEPDINTLDLLGWNRRWKNHGGRWGQKVGKIPPPKQFCQPPSPKIFIEKREESGEILKKLAPQRLATDRLASSRWLDGDAV